MCEGAGESVCRIQNLSEEALACHSRLSRRTSVCSRRTSSTISHAQSARRLARLFKISHLRDVCV